MAKARTEAAKVLLAGDAQTEEKGVYAEAEELVRARGRWNEVLGAVVISKFVRSFIWPSFVASFVLLGLTLKYWAVSRQRADVAALLAACFLLVAAASFPAYAKFRLKHMEQLYRLAKRLKTPA